MKIIRDARSDLLEPAAERHRRGRAPADDADPGERAAGGEGQATGDHRRRISKSNWSRRRKSACSSRRYHGAGPQAARHLPRAAREGVEITLTLEGEQDGGRGRPQPLHAVDVCRRRNSRSVEEINAQQTLKVAAEGLRRLLDKTHFSMAQQDVRYYLNGMLLETDGESAARGGDRRPSAGVVRGGACRKARNLASRSSCRARACWNCSASSATKDQISSWRSAAITFASRSAIFASLRS